MKKRRLLIFSLSIVLVISVGYALFSDTININGTATAEVNFSFSYSCQTSVPSNLSSNPEYIVDLLNELYNNMFSDDEGGYEDDVCTTEGNKVTYSVKLKYPSALRLFTVKAENTGSISAKLSKSESSSSTENLIEDAVVPSHSTPLKNGAYLTAKYNKELDDFELMNDWDKVINPGESIYIIYVAYWDKNDNSSNELTTTVTDTLKLVQTAE